jgi:hypothetical protein
MLIVRMNQFKFKEQRDNEKMLIIQNYFENIDLTV